MTKEEAIQAMEQGYKVSHPFFIDNETIHLGLSGDIIFKDYTTCTKEDFWAHRTADKWLTGWYIVGKSKETECNPPKIETNKLKELLSKHGGIEIIRAGYVFVLLLTIKNHNFMTVNEIFKILQEHVCQQYPTIEAMRNDKGYFCVVLKP